MDALNMSCKNRRILEFVSTTLIFIKTYKHTQRLRTTLNELQQILKLTLSVHVLILHFK